MKNKSNKKEIVEDILIASVVFTFYTLMLILAFKYVC